MLFLGSLLNDQEMVLNQLKDPAIKFINNIFISGDFDAGVYWSGELSLT